MKKAGHSMLWVGLLIILSACANPVESTPQPVDNTPTLAPYSPDTPSPPEIDAPVADSPALVPFNSLIQQMAGV